MRGEIDENEKEKKCVSLLNSEFYDIVLLKTWEKLKEKKKLNIWIKSTKDINKRRTFFFERVRFGGISRWTVFIQVIVEPWWHDTPMPNCLTHQVHTFYTCVSSTLWAVVDGLPSNSVGLGDGNGNGNGMTWDELHRLLVSRSDWLWMNNLE